MEKDTTNWKENIRATDRHKKIDFEIRLGDLLELLVDGHFFQRIDGKPERYAGYLALIGEESLGLAVTPAENKRHGYVDNKPDQPRQIVEIEKSHITHYRILTTYNIIQTTQE